MNVLMLAGVDTGGQGGRITDAFALHRPDIRIEQRVSHPSDFRYPGEVRLFSKRQDFASLREPIEWADVLHLRNHLKPYVERARGKPIVLHHHGTRLRMSAGTLPAEARRIGALQAVSTLDLLQQAPDAEWVPSPFDLEELATIRAEVYEPSPTVRIAHLPTNVLKKSTRQVVDACRHNGLPLLHNLAALGRGRTLRLRTVHWAQALRIKARADVYVDQFAKPDYPGGYGNNAIEAWAMGMPVVAGVSEPTRSVMIERFGELPFVEATVSNLTEVLGRVAADADLRAEYAERGLRHVRRWHDGRETVAVLARLYEAAAARKSVAA